MEHKLQMRHLAVAGNAIIAIFLIASKSQVLYAVFITISEELFDLATFTMGQDMTPHLALMHEGIDPPSFVLAAYKDCIMSPLQIWTFVNTHVINEVPLVPIKSFLHFT